MGKDSRCFEFLGLCVVILDVCLFRLLWLDLGLRLHLLPRLIFDVFRHVS